MLTMRRSVDNRSDRIVNTKDTRTFVTPATYSLFMKYLYTYDYTVSHLSRLHTD